MKAWIGSTSHNLGITLKAFIASCAIAAACTAPLSHGQEIYYFAALTGAAAFPPNSSSASGTALVYVDLAMSLLHIEVNFSGLQGTVAAAHVHGLTAMPGAGVAQPATSAPTLPGFALGVTAGLYHGILDLNQDASYDPAFVAAYGGAVANAKNALLGGLAGGQTYFSIETSAYASGEIRGFLVPSPAADFDHNSRVDAGDLAFWRLAFGEANFGDADDDGDTDGADFLHWQRQFGLVAEIQHHHHAGATGIGVPEPAMPGVVAMSLLSLLVWRRKRRIGSRLRCKQTEPGRAKNTTRLVYSVKRDDVRLQER